MSLKSDFKRIENQREKRFQDYLPLLADNFVETLDEVEERLGVFYSKYGLDGTINISEAESLLTGSDLRIVQKKLDQYQSRAEEIGISFDRDLETRIKTLGKRSSRIEGLRLELLCLISLLVSGREPEIEQLYSEQYDESALMSAFYIFRQAGYQIDLTDDEWNQFENALFESWRADDATFSEMLWRYKRYLNYDATKEINLGIRNELDFATIMLIMEKLFGRTHNNISRMVRSDSTYFGNHGQVDMLDHLGVDSVVYTAIIDERTSEMCYEADGNIIPIDEIEYGWNAPPLHEHCRSFLTPYVEDIELSDVIGGMTDADIMEKQSYKEWYAENYRNKK